MNHRLRPLLLLPLIGVASARAAVRAITVALRGSPGGDELRWPKPVFPGDTVRVLGPSGECFYVPGRSEQPLLLIGTGTGLAPLYGILHDALAQVAHYIHLNPVRARVVSATRVAEFRWSSLWWFARPC